MGSEAEELSIDTAKEQPCTPSSNPPVDGEDYSCAVVARLEALVAGFGTFASSRMAEENAREIRQLLALRLPPSACGDKDGIAPIRASLWSIMLLGLRPEDLNSQHELVSKSLHGRTSEADHAQGLKHFPKEDRRVLAADIKRTRQAYDMFKREDVMKIVSQVLERYCVGHGIRYKQGQNELIAPFITLEDPPLPLPVLGLLFESFMGRFVSRWFVDDEIEALLVSYRVFRVLLFYVDPGLAGKLDEAEFVPELYATAWLITLFSRNLSLELVMRLWDVYLAVNDPALVFFLLAALLVRNRETLMRVDQAHMMPETVQGLGIDDKQDLEELIVQAREMLRKVPETFLSTVRSCCSDHGNTPLDTSRSLFCESVRCASIGPAELLERMSGRSASDDDDDSDQPDVGGEDAGLAGAEGAEGNRSPCPMRRGPVDTVALDIRPRQEFETSGVGYLGKSVRLDPSLLEMEDVLEKWMQHFDGTRGTHVCLVDSLQPSPIPNNNAASDGKPPSSSSKGELVNGGGGGKRGSPVGQIIEDPLWRRLLFGEDMGEEEWVNVSRQPSGGRGRGEAQGAASSEGHGREEPFGAAKAFAEKLHARGFPYVSILEGGMEGVIEHLQSVASPIEPTVINHDPAAFKLWRKAQARREHEAAEPPAATSRAGEAFSWGGKGNTGRNNDAADNGRLESNGTRGGGGGTGDGSSVGAGGTSGGTRPKLGVMDRLGLGRVGQGVSHGVGTVARTGARAVRGGAGMIIPSSRSSDGLEIGSGASGGGGGSTWDGRDRTGSGGVDDGRNLSSIIGAIRDAQAGVRRTSAWAALNGAGPEDGGQQQQKQQQQGGHLVPRALSGLDDGGSQHGEGGSAGGSGEVGGAAVMVAERGGPRLSNDEDGDVGMLVGALKTAEASGHVAMAKVLRDRLGGLAVNETAPSLSPSPCRGPEHDDMLESVADMAIHDNI